MLTAAETAALRNLADKKTGTLTAFVNIAVARRLTELGMAQRSQQGWDITPEGSAYLAGIGPDEGYSKLKLAAFPEPLREVDAVDPEARPSESDDQIQRED